MNEPTKDRLAEIYVLIDNYTNDIVMANFEIAEAEKRISQLMVERKKLLKGD